MIWCPFSDLILKNRIKNKNSQGANGFINEYIIPGGNPTGKQTLVDQKQHPEGEKSEAPEYRRPGQGSMWKKIEYPVL